MSALAARNAFALLSFCARTSFPQRPLRGRLACCTHISAPRQAAAYGFSNRRRALWVVAPEAFCAQLNGLYQYNGCIQIRRDIAA